MNTPLSSQSLRRLALLALGLCCLHLFAAVAFAAGPSLETAAAVPVLQANFMLELVSNRARMIQVSVVFVTLGCALIWWYR